MATILDHNSSPSYYSDLVQHQRYARITSFTLESGYQLRSFPVAFKTWGCLNEERDNVLVVCHALSGSSDIEDWWRPAIGRGPGVAIDISRFFVFCGNVLGSPYGSCSPLTVDPDTGLPYGPNFPQTSVRDDVRIHKLLLDALGVRSVASVIGGSMGGMAALEWPLCSPPCYVKSIIPIATAAKQSAWGISWSEVQRNCIIEDPSYQHGYYLPNPAGQPYAGLSTARMVAMLTYRSCVSFDNRFGRKPALMKPKSPAPHGICSKNGVMKTPPASPKAKFSAQSYLQYQGEKFLQRFDANCYLHLIDKMDHHDLTRGRSSLTTVNSCLDNGSLPEILSSLPTKPLVIGTETDLLFRVEEQAELAASIPDASLVILPSQDGHDGFLLEFEALNEAVDRHLKALFPHLYEAVPSDTPDSFMVEEAKSSVFGELEA